ncbi:MAG: M23 family metallopeptidase [Helicobacteraceae bacterium]|jgi:murein DD-endopeptidase MepM/ murein hydrolase activator NlpD|nr:M23 family metallopeptidase [Helicobacteraceae bacterium]
MRLIALFSVFFAIFLLIMSGKGAPSFSASDMRVFMEDTAYPGGVALVRIGASNENPRVFTKIGGAPREVKTFIKNGSRYAIAAISLDYEPGAEITLWREDTNATFLVQVGDKDRVVQGISVSRKMEALDKKTVKRVGEERVILRNAIAQFNANRLAEMRFSPPTNGRLSAEFGVRRVINGKPRRPHGGADIAAPIGTIVRAPAPARAALVDRHFFCGKFVLLDHGDGLFTLYCHLDRHLVKQGDELEEGEAFAHVGRTGRVTGPHLHWSAALNGAWFDPLLLMSEDGVAEMLNLNKKRE